MKTKSALWWSCVIPSFAHVLSQINALATITTHKRERDYVENKTWRKWTSKCVKFNFSLDTQIKLFIQITPPSHFAGSNFFKICGTDLRGFYLDQIQWIFGKLPNGLWPPHPTPPYFRKTMLRFLQWNFSGCSDPILFLYRKSATKFFGSEMTPPPLRKFSENSSNMVEIVTP